MNAACTALLLACAAWAAPVQASDFTLVDTAGTRHALADYRGKWVVLNVWASWCAPCIQEMPELEAMSRMHPKLVVLGLAADGEDVAKIKRYAGALKVTYPIIAGDAAQLRQFKLRAYPTTLVFNPAGEQVALREGRITHRDIDALVGGGTCP